MKNNPNFLSVGKFTIIAFATLFPHFSGATFSGVIYQSPDRSSFDRSIEVSETTEFLANRQNYPFIGQDLILSIEVLDEDIIIWSRDDTVLQHSLDPTIVVSDLQFEDSGIYRASILRDGNRVDAYPVVINATSPVVGSVVDPTFNSEGHVGLEAIPRLVRADGWVAVSFVAPSLRSERWFWISPDGQDSEEFYSRSGPLSGDGVKGVYSDQSFLLREAGQYTLHHSDETQKVIPFLRDNTFFARSSAGGWMVADSIDVTGYNSQGEITFSRNVSDFGVITNSGLRSMHDGTGRFLVVGQAGDTPSEYAERAVLVESDGSVVSGFRGINFHHQYPSQLTDQSWAHFVNGVVRTFDTFGNQVTQTSIPQLASTRTAAISPEGWLYAEIGGVGIHRFDLQGNRDPNYVVHYPSDESRFGPHILFDHANRPLLGVVEPSRNGKLIRLQIENQIVSVPPIAMPSSSGSLNHLAPFSLQANAFGTGEFSYQWRRLDGYQIATLPEGPVIEFDKLQAEDLGAYQLIVTSAAGTSHSDIIDLRLTERPRLVNLSGRGRVDPANELVAGYVVETRTRPGEPPNRRSKKFMLRGVGPTLAEFGVSTPLSDPVLQFRDHRNETTFNNDNWYELNPNDTLLTNVRGIFPFPTDSKDAHYIDETSSGVFTATISAKPEDSGIALAEIHALVVTGPTELVNLSLRGNVGLEDDVLIGGFIIEDPEGFARPLELLIRAIGPTLEEYDVKDVSLDPKITIFDSAGSVVATNDDWAAGINSNLTKISQRVGAFALPPGSKDAALVIQLPPGAYTSHVGGVDGAIGNAMFEIYRIPPQ